MAKKIKTVAGTDGYEYPVTSYELVVDENGESVKTKLAQLSGSSGGSLSGYVTKETGNANQITFADGQTFQAKLDAGTLKGEKGDKGERGLQGEQGPAGVNGKDGLTTSISVNGTTYTQADGLITLPNYPIVYTKTSELTNDSNFITDTEVNTKIAEAQLGGSGGTVDLSQYATKDDLNNYQEKINSYRTVNLKLTDIDNTGAVDVTNELQSVLDKATEYGGIEVVFDEGTYLTKALRIHKNTTLKLTNNTIILRNRESTDKCMFYNGEYGNRNYATEYNGDGNITIIGGIISGNHTDEDEELVYGHACFALSHGENINITNVKMYDASNGDHIFDISGCRNVNISNCEFNGVYGSQEPRAEMIQIDYTSDGSFPHFGSGDNTQSQNITITNNIFRKNPNNANSTCRTVLGTHSAIGTTPKNITFSNNTVENWKYTCISFPAVDGLYIENNTFNGNGTSAQLLSIANNARTENNNNIKFNNNKVRDITTTSIDLRICSITGKNGESKSLEFKGNTFSNIVNETVNILLYIYNFNDILFEDNNIDIYGKGCWFESCNNININNNIFNEGILNGDAFNFSVCDGINIKNNTFNKKETGTIFFFRDNSNTNVYLEGNTAIINATLMVEYSTGCDLYLDNNNFQAKTMYMNKLGTVTIKNSIFTISNFIDFQCDELNLENNILTGINLGRNINEITTLNMSFNTFKSFARAYTQTLYSKQNIFEGKAEFNVSSFSNLFDNQFLDELKILGDNQLCFAKYNIIRKKIIVSVNKFYFEFNNVVFDVISTNYTGIDLVALTSAKIENNNFINLSSDHNVIYWIKINDRSGTDINTFNNNFEGTFNKIIFDSRAGAPLTDYCKIISSDGNTIKKIYINSSGTITIA